MEQERLELHRGLAGVARDVQHVTATMTKLEETLTTRFDKIEADILELKLDRAKAQGRWSTIAAAGAGVGAVVSVILQVLFH